MNLWLRLIITLLKCIFVKKIDLLATSQLTFRIIPFDCDINIHLTNSRYFSFMDLGRIYHIAHMKNLLATVFKQHWQPVISDVEVKFIKSVKPFVKITLRTRLLTWDERYIYLEQRFFDQKKLYAIALVKGTFLQNHQRVPIEKILAVVGQKNMTAPPMPTTLKHWHSLIEAKKTNENL